MHTLIAPGVAAEDLGAVTPPRPLRSPFRHDRAADALWGMERPQLDGFRAWTHPEHAPTLDGRAHAGADHLRELVEGHRMMHAWLAANRARLLASDGPLAAFEHGQVRVRVILRNTWAYHRILDASLGPALMVDPTTRAAALAAGSWATGVRDPARLEAAFAAERAALLRLDVPYFLADADGADLLADDGATLARDIFRPGGARRLRGRVERIDTFPLDAHAAILESTLATGHPTHATHATRADAPRPPSPPRQSADWIAAAVAAGDLILQHGFSDEGEAAWLGIGYDPLHDLAQVQVLGSDLLTGTAGIAVALSELHAVTGATRFRQAAAEALAPAARELSGESLPPCLGLAGLAGQLWGAARCASVLGAPLPAWARPAIARGLRRAAEQDPGDVATGAVGLALAALALDPTRRDDVERLVQAWDERAARTPDLTPPTARIRSALPGTDAAQRLLRHRLGASGTPTKKTKEVGDLLVDLAMFASGPLAASIASVRTRLTENRDHPLDLAQLALQASAVTADAWFLDRARALAAARIDAHDRDGRWLPPGGGADQHQLSLLWGIPAVIRLFLRLGSERFPFPQPQLVEQIAPG
jgi:hypothetical protein